MGWLRFLVMPVIEALVGSVASSLVKHFKNQSKLKKIDEETKEVKDTVEKANTKEEREEALEKVHDLVNDTERL